MHMPLSSRHSLYPALTVPPVAVSKRLKILVGNGHQTLIQNSVITSVKGLP